MGAGVSTTGPPSSPAPKTSNTTVAPKASGTNVTPSKMQPPKQESSSDADQYEKLPSLSEHPPPPLPPPPPVRAPFDKNTKVHPSNEQYQTLHGLQNPFDQKKK